MFSINYNGGSHAAMKMVVSFNQEVLTKRIKMQLAQVSYVLQGNLLHPDELLNRWRSDLVLHGQ